MAVAANVEQFRFTIQGLEEPLAVLRFEGREAISELYHYQVEVVSENAQIDLQQLLSIPAWLTLLDEDESEQRIIHGIIVTA